MARTLIVLLLALGATALLAACGEDDDFLFDETQPEATGTPPFFQRSPEPSPEPSPTEPAAGVCGDTYIVEAGDYPFRIAEKCGVDPADVSSWARELMRINDIDDATSLRVGQELKLPE